MTERRRKNGARRRWALLGVGLVLGVGALLLSASAGNDTPLRTTSAAGAAELETPSITASVAGATTAAPTDDATRAANTPRSGDAGSAGPDTPDAPYSVTMSPVGTVHFKRPPRRSMCLDANYEDMLMALDRSSTLVATGYEGNHYEGFYTQLPGVTARIDHANLPAVGMGLDKEVLYALQAEVHHIDPLRLTRTPAWSDADIAEITANVGPFFANRFSREHTAPTDAPYTFYSAFELAGKVGEVYRQNGRAVALKAVHDEMVRRIQTKLPPESERPRVGLVIHANGRFTPFALSREGYGTAQYRAVGARDAFERIKDRTYADAGRGTNLDLEGLLAIDPDVLVMPFAIYPSYHARFAELRALAKDPIAGHLRALRTGRVFPGGTPLQGPIFLLFQTEMIAKQLYPDRFGAWREDGIYPAEAQLFDRSIVASILTGHAAVTQ